MYRYGQFDLLHRHLQRFWGASGDYWQRNWEYVYNLFDGDEMSLAMYSE